MKKYIFLSFLSLISLQLNSMNHGSSPEDSSFLGSYKYFDEISKILNKALNNLFISYFGKETLDLVQNNFNEKNISLPDLLIYDFKLDEIKKIYKESNEFFEKIENGATFNVKDFFNKGIFPIPTAAICQLNEEELHYFSNFKIAYENPIETLEIIKKVANLFFVGIFKEIRRLLKLKIFNENIEKSLIEILKHEHNQELKHIFIETQCLKDIREIDNYFVSEENDSESLIFPGDLSELY